MERSVRPLILTWLALLLLLAVSAGVATLPLGWLNNVISLAIALVKTLLVALVFMRLRRSPWLLRLAAMAGIFMVALLFALSATDYATDPVAGRLVGLTQHEAVIERHDDRAVTLHVHFPRIGYQVKHSAGKPA